MMRTVVRAPPQTGIDAIAFDDGDYRVVVGVDDGSDLHL
jgi:hypothetical protein